MLRQMPTATDEAILDSFPRATPILTHDATGERQCATESHPTVVFGNRHRICGHPHTPLFVYLRACAAAVGFERPAAGGKCGRVKRKSDATHRLNHCLPFTKQLKTYHTHNLVFCQFFLVFLFFVGDKSHLKAKLNDSCLYFSTPYIQHSTIFGSKRERYMQNEYPIMLIISYDHTINVNTIFLLQTESKMSK